MTSRKDNSCGIEIQKGLITVAQYSVQDNAVGSIVINPFDDSEETALRAELKKITAAIDLKRQSIAVSVPAQFAVIKTLSLDSDEDDPAGAIIWELSQHIIESIEEYSIDFQPLEQPASDAGKRYLAVAYRTAQIDSLVGMLQGNKVTPHIVDVDVFALVNVFESNYREYLSTPALLVLGAEEKSDVVLTRYGTLVDYDVCKHGQTTLSPDDYASALSDFCGRLCGSWEAGAPRLYCAGSLFCHPEYMESVARKFASAQSLDPFRKIACRAVNGENDMNTLAPQLAVAVGLALRGLDGQ